MPTTYIGMGPDGPNSNLTEMERKARKMKREARPGRGTSWL